MGGWPAGQGAAPGEGLGGLKQSGSQRQEATEAWQAWEWPGPVQWALEEDGRKRGGAGRFLSMGAWKHQIEWRKESPTATFVSSHFNLQVFQVR